MPRATRRITLFSLALLGACSSVDREASGVLNSDWFELIAQNPGSAVTDVEMRRAIEVSGHPWKVRDRATGIEMVLVMPGEFLMGSPESESGHAPHEGPQHRVQLTQPYYLGVTELTHEQWQRLMDPIQGLYPGENLPVAPSWDDVQLYLTKANTKLPAGATPLRLPTEAEWEYACRAGTSGPYPFSGDLRQELVNFNDGEVESAAVVNGRLEVEWHRLPSAACPMAPLPAGSLPANAWGLHDMLGNVWEWCADSYLAEGYPNRGTVSVDPFVTLQSAERRALRGGSFYDNPHLVRAAARDGGAPFVRSIRIGVRLARSL